MLLYQNIRNALKNEWMAFSLRGVRGGEETDITAISVVIFPPSLLV